MSDTRMHRHLSSTATAALLVTGLAAQGAVGAPCFVPQLGTALLLGDDQVAQNTALGFTFPGPAGPVTAIDISSNGFVWLGSNTDSGCCNGDPVTFVSDMPRIAVMWTDLYPPGNGDVYFNTFPASGSTPASAVVTWLDCPEIGMPALQTMQLQLFADGSFAMGYDGRCALVNHEGLVGVTEGLGANAHVVDFSAIGSGSPYLSGTNPTILELQSFTWDLAGRSFAFVPSGTGGYIVLDRPSCTLASVGAFGIGCPGRGAGYEVFYPPAVIDLANTAIEFTPLGGGSGYLAIPATGFFTGYTNSLVFGDDDVQGPFALPFPFSFPGGSTPAIDIASNGFVWLSNGNFDARCCNADPFAFLSDPASIAAVWMDLDPTSGGSIYFDTVGTTEAHITWVGVPEYGTTTPQTAQITLRSDGSFRLAYQNVANTFHTVLAGFSQGSVAVDPGSADFSNGPVLIQAGLPLTLAAQPSSLPAIGATCTMDLDQGSNAALVGVIVLGVTGFDPGVDLTPIGMPGCQLYASLDVLSTVLFSGPITSFALPIPNNSGLAGVQVFAQGAALLPGVNPLGLGTSNGLVLTLGL
jgi:hypothetical protein